MDCGRRHAWRLIWLSLVSAVLAVVGSLVARLEAAPLWLDVPLALAPVVPLVAFFFGFASWIRSLDEMLRLMYLEALVVQFGGTGLLIMGYGALARSGAVPDLPASKLYPFAWLAIFCFWALGLAIVRRKYV